MKTSHRALSGAYPGSGATIVYDKKVNVEILYSGMSFSDAACYSQVYGSNKQVLLARGGFLWVGC